MSLINKVAQFDSDSNLVHQWVHGPASGATSSVTTETGRVRSPAKLVRDMARFMSNGGAVTVYDEGEEIASVMSSINFKGEGIRVTAEEFDVTVNVERSGNTVHVKEFGAVGDGITDDSAAIQAAIDSVFAAGGGTVEFTQSHLLLTGLVIKECVTFRGPHSSPGTINGLAYGTKQGKLILSSTHSIQLHNSSALTNCILMRQGLTLPFTLANAASSVAAFAGTAVDVQGSDVLNKSILVLGFNLFLNSTWCERIRCESIVGDCTNGIYISNCYDIAHINDCHFWPWTTAQQGDLIPKNDAGVSVSNWAGNRRTGTAYKLDRVSDWCKITDSFCYGYETGFWLDHANAVVLSGCGADNATDLAVGVPLSMTTVGFKITNDSIGVTVDPLGNGVDANNEDDADYQQQLVPAGFITMSNCQAAAQGIGLQVGGTVPQSIHFNLVLSNFQAWANKDAAIVVNSGNLTMNGGRIEVNNFGLRVNNPDSEITVAGAYWNQVAGGQTIRMSATNPDVKTRTTNLRFDSSNVVAGLGLNSIQYPIDGTWTLPKAIAAGGMNCPPNALACFVDAPAVTNPQDTPYIHLGEVSGGYANRVITLIFLQNATVYKTTLFPANGTAGSTIRLAGNVDAVFVPNSTLTLMHTGTYWTELGRTVVNPIDEARVLELMPDGSGTGTPGTLGAQNANAVAITGGSVTGLTALSSVGASASIANILDLHTASSGVLIQSKATDLSGWKPLHITSENLVVNTGPVGQNATTMVVQAGQVGVGTNAPLPGTVLDVQSKTGAVRFPNVTELERNAITKQAGSVLYNTTSGKLNYSNGTIWEDIGTGGVGSGTGDVTLTGAQTLTNKTITFAGNTLTGVQPTLVDGTSIKTVNGVPLLGSGNVVISANGTVDFSNVAITGGAIQGITTFKSVGASASIQNILTLTNDTAGGTLQSKNVAENVWKPLYLSADSFIFSALDMTKCVVNSNGVSVGSATGPVLGAALEVVSTTGGIRFPIYGTLPAAYPAGTVIYDSVAQKLSVSNGTAWTEVGGSGGSLTNTTVVAGTYGTATAVPRLTVDAQGRLTGVVSTPISIPSTQVTGLGTVATQASTNVSITGGSVTGLTALSTVGTSATIGNILNLVNDTVGATIQSKNVAQNSWQPLYLSGDSFVFNSLGSEKCVINTNGVSIGKTTGPVVGAALEISNTLGGGIKLPGFATLPTNKPEGTIVYNTTTGKVNFSNGTVWSDVGGTGTVLTPTGVTANSYGSAASVPTYTVNTYGQLTVATSVPINIANTQVTGLGTISTQNSNNVNISGGTISGISFAGLSMSSGTAQLNGTLNVGTGGASTTIQSVANDLSSYKIMSLSATNFVFNSGTSPVNAMTLNDSNYLLVGYAGNQGAYRLQVNGQIFATSSTIATSDARYKEQVTPLTGALDIVDKLRPVAFNWKQHEVHNFTSDRTTGFIAQEVQEVLKDCAFKDSIVKSNSCKLADGTSEEFLGVAEVGLISILTAAIKELKAEVDMLKKLVVA